MKEKAVRRDLFQKERLKLICQLPVLSKTMCLLKYQMQQQGIMTKKNVCRVYLGAKGDESILGS